MGRIAVALEWSQQKLYIKLVHLPLFAVSVVINIKMSTLK